MTTNDAKNDIFGVNTLLLWLHNKEFGHLIMREYTSQ